MSRSTSKPSLLARGRALAARLSPLESLKRMAVRSLILAGLVAILCGAAFLCADRIVVFPNRATWSWLQQRPSPLRTPLRAFLFDASQPRIELTLPAWAAWGMIGLGLAGACSGTFARR